MSLEKTCKNCSHPRVRRGNLYCSLIRQKVSETYSCGKFKPK